MVLASIDISLALPVVVGRIYAEEVDGLCISPNLLVEDLTPPLGDTVVVDSSVGFINGLGLSFLPSFLDSFINSLQDFRLGSRMGGPCFCPPLILCQRLLVVGLAPCIQGM